MRGRGAVIVGLLAAAAGLAAIASSAASAGPPETITLGSTAGSPTANICLASYDCTYVPFAGVANPGLQVPFNGTVTSFSVNAGSAGGVVKLRVLRPASGGQYTGAGTGPPQTLAAGVNTFPVSVPVQAGEVLGLDNESSALMFDTSSASPITAYYELPPLADGSTAAPNYTKTGDRLLLSATVQASPVQTTTTTTTSTTSPAGVTPPSLTDLRQSSSRWREGNRGVRISSRRGHSKGTPALGTTFSFTLNEPAMANLRFTRLSRGRRVGTRCVVKTRGNRKRKPCSRSVTAGILSFTGHAGTNKVAFQGRISRAEKLKPGPYTLVADAANSAGRSAPATLAFTIVK
jgi:hypothetical protein